jgi:hypothetical protein
MSFINGIGLYRYDTEMSTDHDWGPRVYHFLNEQDFGYSEQIQVSLLGRAPGYRLLVRP